MWTVSTNMLSTELGSTVQDTSYIFVMECMLVEDVADDVLQSHSWSVSQASSQLNILVIKFLSQHLAQLLYAVSRNGNSQTSGTVKAAAGWVTTKCGHIIQSEF